MKNRYAVAPLAALMLFATSCADHPGPVGPPAGLRAPSLAKTIPAGPISGAIFTSTFDGTTCATVNSNIYASRADVYVNGGPLNASSPAMPPGWYYVQVTEPDGTLLGSSVGSGAPNDAELVVEVGADGQFVSCYQLQAIVNKHSDGTPGYDATSNPGGEYKVWVSASRTFAQSLTKTDNFKVREPGTVTPQSLLTIQKFYDADADGARNGTEPLLLDDPTTAAQEGWKVGIQPFFGGPEVAYTTYSQTRDAGYYTVSEFAPTQPGWFASTPTSESFTLGASPHTTTFGNYCRYQSTVGARTIGYWKNHLSVISAAWLPIYLGTGTLLPVNNTAGVTSILNGASSTDAVVMLKAQLLGTILNTKQDPALAAQLLTGTYGTATLPTTITIVNSGQPPVTIGTVGQAIAAGRLFLSSNAGPLKQASSARTQAILLKDIFDGINNSAEGGALVVINPTPCAYSFAP